MSFEVEEHINALILFPWRNMTLLDSSRDWLQYTERKKGDHGSHPVLFCDAQVIANINKSLVDFHMLVITFVSQFQGKDNIRQRTSGRES